MNLKEEREKAIGKIITEIQRDKKQGFGIKFIPWNVEEVRDTFFLNLVKKVFAEELLRERQAVTMYWYDAKTNLLRKERKNRARETIPVGCWEIFISSKMNLPFAIRIGSKVLILL